MTTNSLKTAAMNLARGASEPNFRVYVYFPPVPTHRSSRIFLLEKREPLPS